MRRLLWSLAILVAGGGICIADTLILKDGKKIEWAHLHDAGDSLEVETKVGTKITVLKKDVDKVVLESASGPLTGAAFTFDKKRKLETVDLMTKIDPKKALNGEAKISGGTLTITGTLPMNHTKFPTTYTPPEEYDLTMVVERKAGLDDFIVGLVGGGKQVNFHVDSSKSSTTSAHGGEHKLVTVFAKGPRTLRFMVRREGLVVQLDGQDFYTVEGWDKVSLMRLLEIPDKSVLFLGCLNSSFQLSKLILTAPKN